MPLAALDAADADDYALLVADWEREQEQCPKCGRPRSECSDPDAELYPQRVICWTEANRQAAQRLFDDLHDDLPFHDGSFQSWAKQASSSHPFRYDDGMTLFVSPEDLDPRDQFTVDKNARPTRPTDEEA